MILSNQLKMFSRDFTGLDFMTRTLQSKVLTWKMDCE